MALIVIEFFPKESILCDGLNISSEVDQKFVDEQIKDWRKKFVEWFIYKEYVLYKYKFKNMVGFE